MKKEIEANQIDEDIEATEAKQDQVDAEEESKPITYTYLGSE